jgi:hypothetical protein
MGFLRDSGVAGWRTTPFSPSQTGSSVYSPPWMKKQIPSIYSAIAVQLGIPEVAWEAAAAKFGWKKDDGKFTKAMVKGGPTAGGGQGTWDVMFFRFAVNPETKKPDPASIESKMVQINYDGGIQFIETPYSFYWHEVGKDDLARQLADLKSKCKDILNHKAEFEIFKISGTASNALNHAIAPDGSVMLKEEERLGDTPDERFYYFYQGAELKLITYYHSMMGREFEKVEFYFDSNELFSSFSQSMRMGETAREVPWKFAALSEERAYYSVQSQSLGREFLTRTYKSATGDDKGALREKIDQQAPVTIVRGALTELSEKRMDDLLTSLLKVRKKAKPVDKEDADFYNEQAAFAMP